VIETALNFGLGFLTAALLALLFAPLVHKRAVRLTLKRLDQAILHSIGEIRADKDQLRAKLTAATRQLEMSMAHMKAKTLAKLAEFGKTTDTINRLEQELGEKTAAISALEAREKALREQLRTTEQAFEIRDDALHEAGQVLADKEAELVKLVAELGEQTTIADSQRVEVAAIRAEVEAIKLSVAQYEDARKDAELRWMRERDEADALSAELGEARHNLRSLGARRAQQF
jgi:chromosome segregation ATPase